MILKNEHKGVHKILKQRRKMVILTKKEQRKIKLTKYVYAKLLPQSSPVLLDF